MMSKRVPTMSGRSFEPLEGRLLLSTAGLADGDALTVSPAPRLEDLPRFQIEQRPLLAQRGVTFAPVATTEGVRLGLVTADGLVVGDIDGDGLFGPTDARAIVRAIGQTPSTSGLPVGVDGDSDGVITRVDLFLGRVAGHANTVRLPDPPVPNQPPTITSTPVTEFVIGSGGPGAIGDVEPSLIPLPDLEPGQSFTQDVSITLPTTGTVGLVDVFLLFDDTGSFEGVSPALIASFSEIVDALQENLPEVSFGFGVGRYEDYFDPDRGFVLDQPILTTETPGFEEALDRALDASLPGNGGDSPETMLEGLRQVATGAGLDVDGDGDILDGDDILPFDAFTPDPDNDILPASGTLGGAGFREGALPVVLVAGNMGTVFRDEGLSEITGLGGVTVPLADLIDVAREESLDGRAAGFQETVDALNALGALVIGLSDNEVPGAELRGTLESLAILTGTTNGSDSAIPSGIPDDPIDPGDPLFFLVDADDNETIVSGITMAIGNALTDVAFDIDVVTGDPSVNITNQTGVVSSVGAGQTVDFQVSFEGNTLPDAFDLQFVRDGTGVVLGAIPVVVDPEDSTYTYDADAVDPDGDPITFRLAIAPLGATIDPTTGLVVFPVTTPGRFDFRVVAEDGRGGADEQAFTLDVLEGDTT